jgi:hypothetical protein
MICGMKKRLLGYVLYMSSYCAHSTGLQIRLSLPVCKLFSFHALPPVYVVCLLVGGLSAFLAIQVWWVDANLTELEVLRKGVHMMNNIVHWVVWKQWLTLYGWENCLLGHMFCYEPIFCSSEQLMYSVWDMYDVWSQNSYFACHVFCFSGSTAF